MIRSYSELLTLKSFEERFEYLKLGGRVGAETFGVERYLNQKFYKLPEWLDVRDYVIDRDNGADLAIFDREIVGTIIVHHMNPILPEDIVAKKDILLDPEYLISSSLNTHNAIHYGDESLLIPSQFIERRKFDTCPWRH